ncbi:class I SAM-dependent methyltransferase [Pseudohongiella acticola]|jgi:16S rRNA (guanine1516-N2)-methyltransferase|uniref:class I SAM-dependent methyltransferase n=1 Tax=Pseudohongiella acticola TaxID=1524254 RepID=UPI0030ED74D2
MSDLVVLQQSDGASSELLANRLRVPLVECVAHHQGLMLSYVNNRLTLSRPSSRESGAVCVDFNDAKLNFRLTQSLSREAVVKAVGGCVSHQQASLAPPHLIDATAGLGQDAFILAAAGWQVSLVEQSPVVHALLEDGLRRAREAVAVSDMNQQLSAPIARQLRMLKQILARLTLCEPGDSAVVLPSLESASVIYLDPMFPGRGKAARVKKNRFLLQQLHGAEATGEGLLPVALKLTAKVVVKRPRLALPLGGLTPASSLTGKTSRFDIYVGTEEQPD